LTVQLVPLPAVIIVPVRMPDPVIEAPTVIVPVTPDTVRVVPEIEPVQEKLVVEEEITAERETLYPLGVTPDTVTRDPEGIVYAGEK
jgi:hypothetical protein